MNRGLIATSTIAAQCRINALRAVRDCRIDGQAVGAVSRSIPCDRRRAPVMTRPRLVAFKPVPAARGGKIGVSNRAFDGQAMPEPAACPAGAGQPSTTSRNAAAMMAIASATRQTAFLRNPRTGTCRGVA